MRKMKVKSLRRYCGRRYCQPICEQAEGISSDVNLKGNQRQPFSTTLTQSLISLAPLLLKLIVEHFSAN